MIITSSHGNVNMILKFVGIFYTLKTVYTLIFFGDLSLNPIHRLKCLKILRPADQHDFFEFPRMNVLEACHLFAVADAGFDDGLLAAPVVSFLLSFPEK